MTLRIRIDHGQDAGKVYRLAKEGVYVLGRVPSVPLQVLDMKVSKEHCFVIVNGSGESAKTVLHDPGSTHGTQVNGQPLAGKVRLKPGDEIRVGLSILRVLSDGEADVEPEPSRALGETENVDAGDKAAGTIQKRKRTLAPDALVNTEIGGYKVLEKIGQGGMGSVYVAEQLSLSREVALKVLSEKFTSDSNFVDQFVNEARSAAALNHPNVVQVYDVGRQNGRYYFSMEYVSGGSLEEHIAEHGPVEWQDALNWFIDSANALIFAHKREILHRDVKPDNLMLAEDGSAKLCDLGLAKKAANEDMLAAGIIGTPAFISPEAIRRRKDIDVRSDLYSLGCTFYRILTGENPFPGKTVKEILVGHLKAPVPKVMRKVPEVPAQLDEVIQKLMAKEVEERYQTPSELLQDLDKIRVQHGLEAHGLRPASRKPLVIALVAAVLLAGGALAFIVSQDSTTVVEDEEAKIREQEALKAAAAAKLDGDILRFGGELSDLRTEKAVGDLEDGRNWAAPAWPVLIGKFEKLATTIEKHPAFEGNPKLQDVWKQAGGEAAGIREYVELRERLDTIIGKAETKALADFEAGLVKRRADFDDAMAAKDFVKAAILANPETISEFVKPFLEMAIDQVLPKEIPPAQRTRLAGKPLLSAEKQIKPLVAKYFPGTPPGQALLDQAVEGADTAHAAVRAAVKASIDLGTHEALEEARTALEAYLERLPDVVDAKAGPLVDRVSRFRKEANAALGAVEKAGEKLLGLDYIHDRTAWVLLIKQLRAPGGLLLRFKLDDAVRVAQTNVGNMRRPEYKRLAQQVLEDVQALKHLLDRLASTFPAGWAKDRVTWKNKRGRDDSEKAKAVTPTSIKLGSIDYPFEALGPNWLLRHVFFLDAETLQEPRFPFEGEDHRGVAFLAEMAVHYDLVPKHLQTYLATLDPSLVDTQNAVRRRMGGAHLRLERAAAEAWSLATGGLRAIQQASDAMHPAIRGDDDFWDDVKGRKKFVEEQGDDLKKRLAEAWDALNQFRNNEEFAKTVWGIIAQAAPDVGIPYAGESLVAFPEDPDDGDPKDGADKPGDGKPGDGNPGDDKPGDGKPGDDKPGGALPGDPNPGGVKPGGQPGDPDPGDGKPGANKPADGEPSDKPGGRPGDSDPDEDDKRNPK